MNERTCLIAVLLALLVLGTVATAAPVPPATMLPDKPATITAYGTGKDFGLVKVTHIHYAKPADRIKPAGSPNCFKLSGWHWTGPIQYSVAPPGAGLPDASAAVTAASAAWDTQTGAALFSAATAGPAPAGSARDYRNSVYYGDAADPAIIAMTTTWYTPSTKTAVESDVMLDTSWTWGTADAAHPGVMDVQNIATHEIGHSLGLSDLYTAQCSAVTMFGYSDYGETAKQDLEPADITGLRRIYGP